MLLFLKLEVVFGQRLILYLETIVKSRNFRFLFCLLKYTIRVLEKVVFQYLLWN